MGLILDSDQSLVTLKLNSNGVWNNLDSIHLFSIEGIIISLQFLVMVINLFVLQMASSKIVITIRQKYSISFKLKYPLFFGPYFL